MADLALDLGVSTAAASMALRNHPRVSHALVDRARKRAQEMGYQPHPLVRTLMSEIRRGRVAQPGLGIAFLHGWPGKDPLKDVSLTYSQQVHGVMARAADLGYRVEIHEGLCDTPEEGARMSRVFWSRGLHGVIIGPRPEHSRQVVLEWDKFSASAVGSSLLEPHLHRSSTHVGASMNHALNWITRKGARRVGLVQLKEYSNRLSHPWIAAWSVAAVEHPELEFLPWIMPMGHERERAVLDYVKRYQPDVVLSSFAKFCRGLESHMKRVPWWIDLAEAETTDLPGPRQAGAELGRTCVDLVVNQMQRNETGLPVHPQTVLIEPGWIDGKSLSSEINAARVHDTHVRSHGD